MEIDICGTKYTEDDVPVKLAEDALCVQDACNPAGVIHSLSQAVTELHKHKNYAGTDWVKHHPIMIMFLAQCLFLSTNESIHYGYHSKSIELCKVVVAQKAVTA